MVAERTTHAPARRPRRAIDPVCGMQVAVSDATPNLCIGNERVYFCCEGCRSTLRRGACPRELAAWCWPRAGRRGSGSRSSCCRSAARRCSTTRWASRAACEFDQLVCVLGGGADEVRATVDLAGVEVVVNEVLRPRLLVLDRGRAAASIDGDVLVLLLGDQPGVVPASVRALLAGRGDAPLAVCRYDDGRGHPFAFARSVFGELAALHGDKGVWKLLDRAGRRGRRGARARRRPARRRHVGGLRGRLDAPRVKWERRLHHAPGGRHVCCRRFARR